MSSVQHLDSQTADAGPDAPGRPQKAAGAEAAASTLDEQAFEALYRKYRPNLVRYAERRGAADPEGAADLALFDWYRAYDRLDDQTEAALRSYVYRAVGNFATSEHRGVDVVPTEFEDRDLPPVPDPADDVAERWLWDLVDELPPLQRAVVRGRFHDDQSGEAIADLLDRNPNAIYQIQHRALRRLLRMILAGAVVALVVVGIVIRAGWSTSTVDTSPVDQTPTRDDDTLQDPRPDRTPEAGDVETEVSTASTTSTVATPARPAETAGVATTATPGGQPDEPAPPLAPSPTTAAAETTTTQSPSTTNKTTTTSAPATTAAPPSTVPSTTVASVVPANRTTDAFDRCDLHQVDASLSTLKLRSLPSRAAADGFAKPPYIRLLDADGIVMWAIDTSDPYQRGVTPGSHGLIGQGSTTGTYASWDNVPSVPVFWGVLIAAEVTGWTSIESFDTSTATWHPEPACDR